MPPGIPAHAGIHRPTTPMPEKIARENTPSFPQRQKSIPSVIPAFAGMTEYFPRTVVRPRGDDVAGLRGFLAAAHIRRITLFG